MPRSPLSSRCAPCWVLTCAVPSTASRSSIPRSPRCAAARSRRGARSHPSTSSPCLDPARADQGRAQRWQQGTVEIEDWRRSLGVSDGSDSPNAWTRALGPPSEGWEGRRRRRVVANLVAVRRDLGLEGTDRARAVNGGPLLDPATAAVLREVEVASHRLLLGYGMLHSSGGKGEVRSHASG